MDAYVIDGQQNFGKVLHSLVRYEVQSRGSLHTHIVLWLDPVDTLHLRHEVVAHVLATLPHDAGLSEGSTVEKERARLFNPGQEEQLR